MQNSKRLNIDQAVRCLRDGGVLAYPTEAVFGLGCDPTDESAVRRILELKTRPASAGLILIADCYERFERFVAPVPSDWLERALATWPGPVTWLFPRGPETPDWLAGAHPTVALRIPEHPVCRDLCRSFGGAIVSTSANPRGDEPARSAQAVTDFFGAALCGIVAGDLGAMQNPSEIRDLASGRIVRAG